jgi:ribosomal protein S18 acetylase RimI-like enzyme
MTYIEQAHSIQLREYISQAEYEKINQLMELCCRHDNINLKLELGYKLHLSNLAAKDQSKLTGNMKEFLYYIEGDLVAYLGISCFDGATGELCGMTHPSHRRKGYFHRLLALALNECRHMDFRSLLILADGNSESGMSFMRSNSTSYAHSEYRMKRLSKESLSGETQEVTTESNQAVTLRIANKSDERAIARMNAILFDERELTEETGEYEMTPLEEQQENERTYLIKLNETAIGKINVEIQEQYAFLFGFGILPEYRGRGYGRIGLARTLNILEEQGITTIELDVVCTNDRALGLYQSCGFVEQSVMNYYNLR